MDLQRGQVQNDVVEVRAARHAATPRALPLCGPLRVQAAGLRQECLHLCDMGYTNLCSQSSIQASARNSAHSVTSSAWVSQKTLCLPLGELGDVVPQRPGPCTGCQDCKQGDCLLQLLPVLKEPSHGSTLPSPSRRTHRPLIIVCTVSDNFFAFSEHCMALDCHTYFNFLRRPPPLPP